MVRNGFRNHPRYVAKAVLIVSIDASKHVDAVNRHAILQQLEEPQSLVAGETPSAKSAQLVLGL